MMSIVLSLIFSIPVTLFGSFWFNFFLLLIMSLLVFMIFLFDFLIMYLSYGLGLDQLSFVMVILSFWICSLMMLASGKVYQLNNYTQFFQGSILLLLFSLFMAFSSLDFFSSYIFLSLD